MIGDPPVLAGAVHVTANWVLPLAATTDVGLPGTVDRIPIVFCKTNAAMFEVSVDELALEPLDAGFTDSICRGSSDSRAVSYTHLTLPTIYSV